MFFMLRQPSKYLLILLSPHLSASPLIDSCRERRKNHPSVLRLTQIRASAKMCTCDTHYGIRMS